MAQEQDKELLLQFESLLPHLRSHNPSHYDNPEKLQSAWHNFLETVALAETARNRGLANKPEISYRIAQILSQELISHDAETVRPLHSIPESDVREHFELNKASFDLPATLGANEIVLKFDPSQPDQRNQQHARASALVKSLGTGHVEITTFMALAKANSDAESFRSNGGYLGTFPVRSHNNREPPLPKHAIEELIRVKTVGRITGPIECTNAFVILRLSAYREAVPTSFESVKESIRYALYLKARNERIKDLCAESGFNLEIRINEQTIQSLLPNQVRPSKLDHKLPPSPTDLGIPVPESLPDQEGDRLP